VVGSDRLTEQMELIERNARELGSAVTAYSIYTYELESASLGLDNRTYICWSAKNTLAVLFLYHITGTCLPSFEAKLNLRVDLVA